MGSYSGHDRRFARLMPKDKPAIWHPVDDSLISGPVDRLRDPADHFSPELLHNLNAVIGFRGLLSTYGNILCRTPTVMNLSASTMMGDHTHKVVVSTVENAVSRGADAVAFHVNFTAPQENEMLQGFSMVVEQAERYGMPVVAFAYARGRHADGTDNNYLRERSIDPDTYCRLVQHAVRSVVDLGAAAVKTTYTGSAESFARVVDGACGVPVLISGEQFADEEVVLERAATAVSVGGRGVAFGRQIYERKDAIQFTANLRAKLDEAYRGRLVQ